MRIDVCDICLSKQKLTKATGHYKVKRHRELRLDYCDSCKSLVPEKYSEYIKHLWKVKWGHEPNAGQLEFYGIK